MEFHPYQTILAIIVILGLAWICFKIVYSTPAGKWPFDTGKVKLPGPDRDQLEEGLFRFDLDMLLDKREELEKALAKVSLKEPAKAAEVCTNLRQFACRQKNIAALALAAALCRLCPEGLPDGEAHAREGELLHLTGNGEGHLLLGLSQLSLYAHFRPQHKDLARDAWRRAVEHFRLSGFAGHQDGMEAAALLCSCGHDLPFTPPESFQAYQPLLEASNTDAQEDFFYSLDDSADYLTMHLRLPFEAPNPAAPEALFWNVQLAEAGDPLAMHYLATLWTGTQPPDMARAEECYRRSMEAGNSSNAADALSKLYLTGSLPDETGQKTAICLIFSACEEWRRENGCPEGQSVTLSDDDLAQLKENDELGSEIGRRAKAQLDACKAEGEALHAQAKQRLQARKSLRQEETSRCLEAARQKLSALCELREDKQQHQRQPATAAPRTDGRETSRARPDKH